MNDIEEIMLNEIEVIKGQILYDYTYIWNLRASLVAQLVKNLPAMWETWVPSLG